MSMQQSRIDRAENKDTAAAGAAPLDLADGLLIDAEIDDDQVQNTAPQILHPAWLVAGLGAARNRMVRVCASE